MRYSFNDGRRQGPHTIQYFEMFGNRGIYYDGWTAVTRHSIPWELTAESTPSMTTSGNSTTPTPTGRRP